MSGSGTTQAGDAESTAELEPEGTPGSQSDIEPERPPSSYAELVFAPPGPAYRTMVQRNAVTGYVEHPTVVEFTYTRDAVDLHDRWRAEVGSPPCHMIVDASGRSDEIPGPQVAADGGTLAVEAAHPQDLTGLCMKWQDALREARGRGDLFVAFDSVTHLLQYVELREAYRFLHTLVAGVHRAGARAQFYLDPAAHDERTRSTVEGLFDRIRRLD